MPLRSVPIEFGRNNRWSKTTNGRIIGRPQEAIMATRSGKTGLFAFDPARCDALSEVLAERWWAVGLRGILAIIFGLICLLTPGIALGAFVIVFAAYMFVDGVFAIISGIRAACSFSKGSLILLPAQSRYFGPRLHSSCWFGSLQFGRLCRAH